jgi:hypothetical protein
VCREIIELLASNLEVDCVGNQKEASGERSGLDEVDRNKAYGESVSEEGRDDELSERHSFKKPPDMLFKWFDDVELSALRPEESGQPIKDAPVREDLSQDVDISPLTTKEQVLFQLTDYEKFIQQSDAYQWLLSKIHQHGRLASGNPNLMFDIGARIRNQLRAQEPLRRISRRRPPSLVRMTFNLDWNPICFIHDRGFTSLLSDVIDKVLCLTGSWDEAQAVTMMEYITQTWPVTGGPIIKLLQELISLPEGQECSCRF